jgi:molecular chaperone GrpE
MRIPVTVVPPERDSDLASRAGSTRAPDLGGETASRPGTAPVADSPAVDTAEETAYDSVESESALADEAAEWRERALRLQSDQANYRQRQQRLAEERIDDERRRLLLEFLPVVDDLERALGAAGGSEAALHQGVHLTRQAAVRMLEREGVAELQAVGNAFDPNWHEAVATTAVNGSNVSPGTVVGVVESGYRIGEQLLRPAKVVVAV